MCLELTGSCSIDTSTANENTEPEREDVRSEDTQHVEELRQRRKVSVKIWVGQGIRLEKEQYVISV